MKTIWGRLGVSLDITDEEEKAIFDIDSSLVAETLRKVVADGRFMLDGDSYIPEDAVRAFNEQHGTAYETCDIRFDF